MKLVIFLVLSFLVLPFTMGASIIDKETKRMVEELNYKIEKIIQYGHANHAEQMKAAKEQSDLLERLTSRVEAIERRERASAVKDTQKMAEKPAEAAVVNAPTATVSASPTANVAAAPAATSPVSVVNAPEPAAPPKPASTTTPIAAIPVVPAGDLPAVAAATPRTAPAPNPAEPLPQPPAPPTTTVPTQTQTTSPAATAIPPATASQTAPAAQAKTQPPAQPPKPVAAAAAKRPDPKAAAGKSEVSSFDGILPYLISVLSVLLMIVLFVRMKRSEQRIKTLLWRADMEALREDLARERKMNPKIHLTGEPNKVHLP